MIEILTSVLKAYINNEKAVNRNMLSIDWDSLYEISNAHQISGIVFYMLKEWIGSDDAKRKFKIAYYSSISLCASRTKINKGIEKPFRDQKIPFAFIKGACLTDKYPNPALRTMGDIDILVPQAFSEKAKELIVTNGFAHDYNENENEISFSKQNIKIELHSKLLYVNRGLSQKAIDFFNGFEPYIQENGRLDQNFHFLYLFAHLIKHMAGHGAGIRQFMDIAILTKNDDLNWPWIMKKAEELNLLTFVENVLSLNSVWFGVAAPVECHQLNEGFIERATNEIFNNGVFGYEDDEFHKKAVAKEIMKSGKQYKSIKIKTMINSIFPNRESLLQKAEYQYLKKYAFLIPVAWIQRFVNNAFLKNKMKNFYERVFVSKKDVDKQLGIMKEWGIYLR